jgi:hypothetical protein
VPENHNGIEENVYQRSQILVSCPENICCGKVNFAAVKAEWGAAIQRPEEFRS